MTFELQKIAVSDCAAIVERLWSKDPTLWSLDEDTHDSIERRLGWLAGPRWLHDHMYDLRERTAKITARKWARVVLLGMGGSSLAPAVLARIAPSKHRSAVQPEFVVLDSTHPDTVRRVTEQTNPADTLFLVSSKSGETLEVTALLSHFYELLVADSTLKEDPGRHFVAITDIGTPLEVLAKRQRFLDCFLNPSDIGGRFSALTYFGMVPAALVGIDLDQLLKSAEQQAEACQLLEKNDAFLFGWQIGTYAARGRNKLTLLLSPEIKPLGVWIEQLLAESIGKDGCGIVPIVGEPLLPSDQYGDDRLFVAILSEDDNDLIVSCEDLESRGFPVFRICAVNSHNIGGEFFRWEFATAVAGIVLGVNPFNEPDVQRTKDATALILADQSLPGQAALTPCVRDGELSLLGQPKDFQGCSDFVSGLRCLFAKVSQGDYIAILAWLDESKAIRGQLEKFQADISLALRVPVILDFGPRYLHSTGQLYKGGANEGVFLQITSRVPVDVKIAKQSHSFSQLLTAQADADFAVLADLSRRVARADLGRNPVKGLNIFSLALKDALWN